jgi:hypothetical protein
VAGFCEHGNEPSGPIKEPQEEIEVIREEMEFINSNRWRKCV